MKNIRGNGFTVFAILVLALLVFSGLGAAAGDYLIEPVSDSDHITVLDADPGTDDAVAIFLCSTLLGEPDIYVASAGNVPALLTRVNMQLLKETFNLKGAVFNGAVTRVDGSYPQYDGFCGRDGIGGQAVNMLKNLDYSSVQSIITSVLFGYAEEEKALAELGDELLRHDSITYITTGPVTTLAKLLTLYPELTEKIDSVYVMGGGFALTNAPHESEYNMAGDPDAAGILFSSGLDVTLIPLDATNTYGGLMPEDIENLKNTGEFPIITSILEFGLQTSVEFGEGTMFQMCDPVAVTYVKSPDLFAVEDKKINIDEYGHIEEAEDGYPVHVVTSFNENLMRILMAAAYVYGDE